PHPAWILTGGEQGGTCPDVGREDVRRLDLPLIHQTHEEPAHRPRCEKLVTALGTAEARKVDRDEVRLFGEHRPRTFEGVDALGPRTGEDERLVVTCVALGNTNVHAV